ncbi:hypothetical protein YC2023_019297 [Brassica napus]
MAAFLNPNSYDVLKKLDEHLLSHLVSPCKLCTFLIRLNPKVSIFSIYKSTI